MSHHHKVRPATKKSEFGAGLVEYALLLSLIAVVVFGAVSFFGASNNAGFGKSKNCIEAAYDGTLGNSCPTSTNP
ncbi:MAG: hypothetical protein KDA95_01495 [Acidimicrobiales bacterium]|nr:hypothetical protein [Acidimicrobiales bacterium]